MSLLSLLTLLVVGMLFKTLSFWLLPSIAFLVELDKHAAMATSSTCLFAFVIIATVCCVYSQLLSVGFLFCTVAAACCYCCCCCCCCCCCRLSAAFAYHGFFAATIRNSFRLTYVILSSCCQPVAAACGHGNCWCAAAAAAAAAVACGHGNCWSVEL